MLTVENLVKSYGGDEAAVKGISFRVGEGEFYTLLGPSGCGKTTTLRCVAGLEKPNGGMISIGEEKVFSASENIIVPGHKRDIGMVFQSYAIWPHMTVFDNVAFPLKHSKRKVSRDQLREKVMKALSLVQLEGFADRPSPFLSGGQQQRVALARALVYEPKVLLLDEPLSNLDAKLREEMRVELKLLVGRLGITTLYVTHDQAEALALSDRVAVMNFGVIIQEGTPRQIYLEPKDAFTANFIGKTNIFSGKVATPSAASGTGAIQLSVGRIDCALPKGAKPNDHVQLLIRPEGIQLLEAKPEVTNNVIPGEILVATFQGDSVEYQVRVGEQECRVKSNTIKEIGKSREVFLHLPPERCLVIEHA
ncbi:MAG TPA: ABC transporter ATP-binding protein [Candidatus Binatia bacterium]|nr:ABC transporter ATP-binding protein [Candidatus Binatia bacterium]